MITGQDLAAVFISPNESDRNMEPANIVDGLFAIARALEHVADRLEALDYIAYGMQQAEEPDHE